MDSNKWLIIPLAIGAVMLIVAIILFLVLGDQIFTSDTTDTIQIPDVTLEPPASLSELADEYPELATVLTDPELDSIYKEFLMAYQDGGEEAAIALAEQRGILTPEGDIRVTLVLDTDDPSALAAQLEASGVTVVTAYEDRINITVPMALVEAEMASDQPGAIFTQLTELQHVIAVRFPQEMVPHGSAVDGEGVAMINADEWHDAGLTGEGIRIGVLDLGFAHYEDLLGEELPDQVTVEAFGWYDLSEFHGTSCAEIIHEIAPDAELYFAWFDGTDATFAQAADWLLSQGVDIISASIGKTIDPRDGSGWLTQRVNAIHRQGVLWVNSSGNEGDQHHRGRFTDTDNDGYHEFSSDEEMLPLPNLDGFIVQMIWEDEWDAPTEDYDLIILDSNGYQVAVSQNGQSGVHGQTPTEAQMLLDTYGETYYLAIYANPGAEPVTFDLFFQGVTLESRYITPNYSVTAPGDALEALTVGAVNWQDDSLAEYSSQGPTPDERLKPEISAPTGVSGTLYDTPGGFTGTSASCPHVAGASALVWQAYPEFSNEEVEQFLIDYAIDLGPSGYDSGFGYGRLNLPHPPTAEEPIPPTPQPEPEDTDEPEESDDQDESSSSSSSSSTSNDAIVISGELIALTGFGLVVGGLACGGAGLLFFSVIGIVIVRRRRKKRRQAQARAMAQQARAAGVPCPNCGTIARPGAKFCAACGQQIE